MISLSLMLVKDSAATLPKLTPVAFDRWTPWIVTVFVPATGPAAGLMLKIVGNVM